MELLFFLVPSFLLTCLLVIKSFGSPIFGVLGFEYCVMYAGCWVF